jgi:hypothetical protein
LSFVKQVREGVNPDNETVELFSEGYIESAFVDALVDCWDMINHLYDDNEEMFSDAEPGLLLRVQGYKV